MQLRATMLRRLVYHNAVLVEFSPIVTIIISTISIIAKTANPFVLCRNYNFSARRLVKDDILVYVMS